MTSPPPLQMRPRSVSVTLLAWVMMGIGGIGLPTSVISALMLLAKSYGTANANGLDACIVILGPFILIIMGIGLLRRQRWARVGTLAILVILMASQGGKLIQGPRQNSTSISESGVKTTTIGSGPNLHSWPILLVCTGVLLKLLSGGLRREFSSHAAIAPQLVKPNLDSATAPAASDRRGWRVGHHGRDMMYYEEIIAGSWQRIDISGEMLMGRAHHVIYFASEEGWRTYPEWARHRRSEIIARITSEFREPDYEYHLNGPGNTPPSADPVLPGSNPAYGPVTLKQRAAVFAAIMFMLGITCGMGWLVTNGIKSGETIMPSKRVSLQRILSREQEPASYWAALGVYTLIGLGSGAATLWLTREACRLHPR